MTRTLDILDRLVGFDTVSARTNLPLIAYVEDILRTRGFRVTRLDDPEEEKAGLYAEIGPAGPGILLSAHSDVVPVEGQVWSTDPFRLTRQGDRLHGRGTTDMKGFVAAMLAAADAASRMPLREPLKLVLSYDEEVGCTGIARMLDRLLPLIGHPRMAIVGEPTEMRVATGHKGKRAFRARFKGEAGHSALAPRFVNALNVAAEFLVALQALQKDLERNGARDEGYDIPYSTVHFGTLSGGRALNIVPDHAEASFEFRHLAADDPDTLFDRIDRAAQEVCARYGPGAGIEIAPLAGYPGLDTPSDSETVRFVETLAGAGRTKVAFGTEAGFFDGQGIPTVVCGPGSMEAQGHKADEFIHAGELARCDAMLARLLERMQ
ncbi:acetylornithine deacetylase [Cribrihabitans sp. XS_ASV171]